jgi:aminopeptidase N
MTARTLVVVLVCLLAGPLRSEADVIHHDLRVELFPKEQRLTVTDTLTLPPGRSSTFLFRLHAELTPDSPQPGVKIEALGKKGLAAYYRATLPPDQNQLILSYSGRVHHPLDAHERQYARQIRHTAGQISSEGVFLSGGSAWYPQGDEHFLTFSLHVRVPEQWKSVSQGRRVHQAAGETTWRIDQPQEQIFLVAGPLIEYQGTAGATQALVFLRQPEPELAQTYLDATDRYIRMYEHLIGPYPYSKFALVENYWETGYGMPSFTLMGGKIIRFPFIVHSSYPHEILHNWWGNSVYPLYEAGNWAEGLTAYLSDHLIREQRGQAADYRQTVLQKYTDYAAGVKDFPLAEFTGRHSSATEAVGYGKAMMFFHMLRQRLGDSTFISALQAFYRDYRFKTATYSDLQHTFEAQAGKPLWAFFDQWVNRTGAPQLCIELARVHQTGGRHILEIALRQRQPGPVYVLDVPIAVTLAGEPQARLERVAMDRRIQKVTFSYDQPPLRLDIDPQYDLFRRLALTETPPALSQVFAAEKILVVLPSGAAPENLDSYHNFARALEYTGPQEVTTILDKDLQRLPNNRTVVLLGWENRFRTAAENKAADYGAALSEEQVVFNEQKTVQRQAHSVVLAVRHPENSELVLAWIAADPPLALPGLARKLPHYHKYSYLAFAGEEPDNILTGRWQVVSSPLTVFFTDERPDLGILLQEAPLIAAPRPIEK